MRTQVFRLQRRDVDSRPYGWKTLYTTESRDRAMNALEGFSSSNPNKDWRVHCTTTSVSEDIHGCWFANEEAAS